MLNIKYCVLIHAYMLSGGNVIFAYYYNQLKQVLNGFKYIVSTRWRYSLTDRKYIYRIRFSVGQLHAAIYSKK